MSTIEVSSTKINLKQNPKTNVLSRHLTHLNDQTLVILYKPGEIRTPNESKSSTASKLLETEEIDEPLAYIA